MIAIDSAVSTASAVNGGIAILEAVAPEWRRLADTGWNDHPFCRPEWITACARAFYPDANYLLASARTGGQLSAVLPFVRERATMCGVPVRLLRNAGNQSARFDIVRTADPVESDAAISSLWETLRDTRGWDVMEFSDVPEGSALSGLFAAAERDGCRTGYRPSFWTPYIPIPEVRGSAEDPWLANTSSHFRGSLRRKTRRLAEQGALRLERVDHADAAALQLYADLEQSSWKGEKSCAFASDERKRQFNREIAEAAAGFGHLSLYLLKVDNTVVAGSFGFTYRDKFFFYRCAFHDDYYQYSPGHILINWILRDCAARRVTEFDFVGEGHEWKRPWTPLTREHGFHYIFRRGLFGNTLHSLKFGLVPLGRKLLRKPLPGRGAF